MPVRMGRAEHQARLSTVECSRGEPGGQTASMRGTAGQRGEVKPPRADQRAEPSPAHDTGTASAELWEQVWKRQNLFAALERVERNGGAPGIDGMTVDDLRPYLKEHWLEIRQALDQQTYQPQPVRRVEIPKPDGGIRLLGIPAVMDRFLQQAIAQALTPLFDPLFSPASYGFRPGRNAHQAMQQAQGYVQAGYEWVVDIDLEKFFDRVNHDMLMARVARVVKDKRVLKLIRAYLNSGVMVNGVVLDTDEGTPQGGPLSPLLSNIMLDDLDKELEQRGHKFVRYADDCNIYVKTQRAGERVMESVRTFLDKKLKLKVNPKKSKVDRASRVKFLGFSLFKRNGGVLIRVASRSLERFRGTLRRLTKRTRSGKLEDILQDINQYTMGWKRWKRGTTRYEALVKLGVPRDRAALGAVGTSPWRMSKSPVVNEALSNTHWCNLGLKNLKDRYQELRGT